MMRYALPLLALSLALLLASGAGPARGSQPFDPSFDITSVSSILPGEGATVSRTIEAPAGGHALGKEVLSVPAGWGIKPDAAIADGTPVGGGIITANLDCDPGTPLDAAAFNILEEDLEGGSPLKARWITNGIPWEVYSFEIRGSDAAGHTITTFFGNGSSPCAPMSIFMHHDANVMTNPTAEGVYTWSSQLTSSPLPPGEHVVTRTDSVAIGTDADGDTVPDFMDNCPSVPNGPFQAGELGVGNQTDLDGDGLGDACDPDDDGDTICDPGKSDPSCSGSDNCQFVAEDFDSYQDGDGCPEIDNDGDTICDPGKVSATCTGSDNCPGSDATAGPDGFAGTADDNPRTSEDFDAVLDSDGCYDPPGADFDGDGWSDDAEALFLGTDAARCCSQTPAPNDEDPDPAPPDFNDNQVVGIDDVFFVSGRFNAVSGGPSYTPRAEIASQNGVIGIDDVFAVSGRFNQPA